jgi:hypothetical protein
MARCEYSLVYGSYMSITNSPFVLSERLGNSVETEVKYKSMKQDIESHHAITIHIEVKDSDLAVLLVPVRHCQ